MDVSIEVTGLITIVMSVLSSLATKHETRKREANVFFEKLFEQFNKQVFLTNENEVEKTLSLLSQVCYYKDCQLITEKQFSIFENAITQYLARPNVLQHMRDRMTELQVDEESSAYCYLLPYMPEDTAVIEEEGVEVKSAVECESLSWSDFHAPTMIIKVNRLYREGMSATEIYEVTRQWWRVNGAHAQMMKYALAVAHGIVKEVFEIDTWHCGGEKDECPGRWCFEGRVADEATRKRFINKSVKSLFKKGAMTPIRYFDGH